MITEKWKALRSKARRFKMENNYAKAIELMEQAIKSASEANPLEVALMYNSLAGYYLHCHECRLAEEAARKSISIESEFGDSTLKPEPLATYFMMLALVMEQQGRFCDAVKYVDSAIEIFQRLNGPDDDYVKQVSEYRDRMKENSWRG